MDWNMVREAPLGARVKHVFSVKPPVRMMILMNHWWMVGVLHFINRVYIYIYICVCMYVCFFYTYTSCLHLICKRKWPTHMQILSTWNKGFRGNCGVYWAARDRWTIEMLTSGPSVAVFKTPVGRWFYKGLYHPIPWDPCMVDMLTFGVYWWDPWSTILIKHHGSVMGICIGDCYNPIGESGNPY